MSSRGKLAIGLAGLALAAIVLLIGQLTGLTAFERHRGYFAPVWADDGQVYLLERATAGFVWGFGWEHFTPPAYSYVVSDTMSLLRLDPATGAVSRLERFEGSPIEGRVTQHYRGRIFNALSARLVPEGEGVAFSIVMDVPRVPTSEQWSLVGRWTPQAPSDARWSNAWGGSTASPDQVLRNGVELMVLPGRESFPVAALAVGADGSYRVLLSTGVYDDLYPDGVSAALLAERALRPMIERSRVFERVQSELVARYRSEGLSEGEAMLRANDAMEELGYLPKRPRLVATAIDELPSDVRVFEIPEQRFRVGLFQDIAQAIRALGVEVETDTGTYLKYEDDDSGPQLRNWREAGNDRFAVRVGTRLYLLEVRRGDR